MFTRIPDSSIKQGSVLGAVLISSVISLACIADDLLPAELRFLAIETEVAIESDWQTAPYDLKVDVQKGSLVVTGEVADDAIRAVAERIARRACRAYSIEIVNKIRVKPGETPPGSVKESPPTTLDEKQVDKLRELLVAEFPDVAEKLVVTFELQPMPAIVLEGLVPTYEQKLEISRFVRREFRSLPVVNNTQVRRQREGESIVYGVSRKEPRAVVVERDRTDVSATKKPLPPTDAELAEQLTVVLKNDPIIKDFNVELTVDDGVVWLAGRVVSSGQKMRAIRLAEEHPGVRYVIDRLGFIPGAERTSVKHIPDRMDVIFYMRRYLRLRWPELLDSTVRVVDQTIMITPQTERLIWPGEITMIENFLTRIPELKAYTFQVRPKLSVTPGPP
jgi:osmotically-inducible protein OsmY